MSLRRSQSAVNKKVAALAILWHSQSMTLGDYLKKRQMTAKAFAAEIGVHVSTITRAVKGTQLPKPDTMGAIAEATNQQVTPADFYPNRTA